jgi:hypothetical protein
VRGTFINPAIDINNEKKGIAYPKIIITNIKNVAYHNPDLGSWRSHHVCALQRCAYEKLVKSIEKYFSIYPVNHRHSRNKSCGTIFSALRSNSRSG